MRPEILRRLEEVVWSTLTGCRERPAFGEPGSRADAHRPSYSVASKGQAEPSEMGWQSFTNGQLMKEAGPHFDVFVTLVQL